MAFELRPEHFVRAGTRDQAKQLFAASVNQVEIEVFTYCNRACWFCPNSHIDRRSANRFMDESLYLRILSELAEIDYNKVITYSRYNEPLANRIFLQRLREARAALPRACLSTFTNGDYLTRPYLDELRDAGLNRIHVMTYLGDDEPFSDTKILTRMMSKVADLGLPCEFTLATEGVGYWASLSYDGMEVDLGAKNFAVAGTDRGKLVQVSPYVRTSWCPLVFRHVYIDWNGCVVPCCNIRSDAPEHVKYIVDDLSAGRSIFEAYASSSLVDWRRTLLDFGPKPAPCDSCCIGVMKDTPKTRAVMNLLAQLFIK
jgi:hypothetical protein